MKKKVTAVFLLLVMVVCVIPLGGCGNDDGSVRNLMKEFEYACNSLDVDAILDCIHPDVTQRIKTAMGIVGLFTGKDSDDMLEAISAAITNNASVDAASFFSSVKIEVKDIQSEGGSATVKADIKYQIGGRDVITSTKFLCSKYEDKWYINRLGL